MRTMFEEREDLLKRREEENNIFFESLQSRARANSDIWIKIEEKPTQKRIQNKNRSIITLHDNPIYRYEPVELECKCGYKRRFCLVFHAKIDEKTHQDKKQHEKWKRKKIEKV